MSLKQINSLDKQQAYSLFEGCCCATNWVNAMIDSRPFADTKTLLNKAQHSWEALSEPDFLEAFTGHPQIGDLSTLQEKYAHTAGSAGHEQASMSLAEASVIEQMFLLNKAYKEKFGFIFIVCASGKSAAEMLSLITQRMNNNRQQELLIAAGEQAKITAIRLEKLV